MHAGRTLILKHSSVFRAMVCLLMLAIASCGSLRSENPYRESFPRKISWEKFDRYVDESLVLLSTKPVDSISIAGHRRILACLNTLRYVYETEFWAGPEYWQGAKPVQRYDSLLNLTELEYCNRLCELYGFGYTRGRGLWWQSLRADIGGGFPTTRYYLRRRR